MPVETIKTGFGYKARRGKDTACRAIVHCLGDVLDIRQYAFADALRAEIVMANYDRWIRDHPGEAFDAQRGMENLCRWAGVLYDANAPKSREYPIGKQRALYQWWVTEYRRKQDPDYWVKRLALRIEREHPAYAVISDVRFQNEFDFCNYRIRMDRPGFEIADGAHHISEHRLDALPDDAWSAVITATSPREVETKAIREFLRIYQAIEL
jgi:hypothetical protein